MPDKLQAKILELQKTENTHRCHARKVREVALRRADKQSHLSLCLAEVAMFSWHLLQVQHYLAEAQKRLAQFQREGK